MRITIAIDPGSFVESHHVDHESVTFPVSEGMACPGRIELVSFRMRPSIHIDVAPDVCAAFVYDQNALLLRQLNGMEWKRRCHRPRPPGGRQNPSGSYLDRVPWRNSLNAFAHG